MWDEPLNTTIDEVARQMTEGAPGDGGNFRRRVIARIQTNETPRASRRPLFVVASLASLGAIVRSLVMARQAARVAPSPHRFGGISHPEPAGASRPPRQPEISIATSPTGPAHADNAGTMVRLKPEPADAAQATVRLGPVPRSFSETRELDTPPIDPLDVAPLIVETLKPDPIAIERLENIAPIAVAPLDITDSQRRDP